jgi:hypothetical protein
VTRSWVLLAMTALSAASCDAVLGIQRFGEPGAGMDATVGDGEVPEGGRDAADGGRDARTDSSEEKDQTTAEGGDDDTEMEATTCFKVTTSTPPSTGLAACPPDGTCYPADETMFTPTWVSPPSGTPNAKLCTTKQISDSYTSCYGTGSTSSGCQDWMEGNAKCSDCLFSDLGASHYGAAIVETGAGGMNGYTYPNVAGCVALAEPCNLPCAKAILDDYLCAFSACDIADGGLCASASEADLTTCLSASDSTTGCSCYGYSSYDTCTGALLADPANHPAAGLCSLGNTNFQPSYMAIATFICGP